MIPYIINVAIVLACCLTFYKLLLQKETFYRMNRWVLIVCLVISFTLPLIPVPQGFSFRNIQQNEILAKSTNANSQTKITNPSAPILNEPPSPLEKSSSQDILSVAKLMQWAVYLYWFGVIAFAFNFFLQLIQLLYRAYTCPVIIDGKFRIVEISGDKAPCSFSNNIFINPEKYEPEIYEQILLHEKIHVQQRHTIDILFAELMIVFQWFNPFAWLYRKEVENNLEFLTDDQLVHRHHVEKLSYQLSLVKVSAPHLPLSLTTNYNQSLLKKRIAMMNSKKSNLHTAWKYFFLMPLLVILACLLNEPAALSQQKETRNESADNENWNDNSSQNGNINKSGSWFGVIKRDSVSIQFKNDEDNHSYNNSLFGLNEFSNIPRGTSSSFQLKREAGTMEFTGKFEGDQGMGKYTFSADQDYAAYMGKEVNEKLSEQDQLAFFFINIKKSYLEMLKSEGYTNLEKNTLIPLAALNVDAAFIRSLREGGMKNIDPHQLIPLKALGIDGKYIKEIRDAGYPDISEQQLISLKAQNIQGDYIRKIRGSYKNKNVTVDDIVSNKAMNISEEDISAYKKVGYDLTNEDLVAMKATGVTPEYIKGFQDIGYNDIPAGDFVAMKSQNITPEYVQKFEAIGYKNLKMEHLVGMKATGVTPEFIKSFEPLGYKIIDFEHAISAKATGITPEYIKSMQEKGFKYKTLEKYVALKAMDESRE